LTAFAKAKVEVGVQIVGRWILARLRNRQFFTLAALNEAIRGLLIDLNDRMLRGPGRSRRQLFDELDRPALLPLPDQSYEYAEWKRCRVNLDYHVEIAKHYYSVPHGLVHKEVEARITARTVEIFLRGQRVASHLRSALPHRPTTVAEHMPSSHRRYRDWTHQSIRNAAAKIGPDTDALIDVILRSRPHPEQGFRSAIGILGLAKRYGAERLDAACARALLLNARSYKSVAAILKNGKDKASTATTDAPTLFHSNIRGRGYYN
jgi:transposase